MHIKPSGDFVVSASSTEFSDDDVIWDAVFAIFDAAAEVLSVLLSEIVLERVEEFT